MFLMKKEYLDSPSKFEELEGLKNLVSRLKREYNLPFDEESLLMLLLSALRCDDVSGSYGILKKEGKKRYKRYVDELKVEKWFKDWLKENLIPNTVVLQMDDPEILKLLLFSIEITYSMFLGESRATLMQKGFRERKRSFEAIVVDQFIGKLGEVAVKRFLEDRFNIKIEIDWDISPQKERYINDIKNAKKLISIKTTPNLQGIWAEADKGYDYGIMVKCSVPLHPLLQFFVEVCGFRKLLDFAEEKLDSRTSYIDNIRNRLFSNSQCGQIKTKFACYICGYFEVSDKNLRKKGEYLEYLEDVREERHFVRIDELKHTQDDWREFIKSVL
jgi:hypothetical protein